MLARGGQLVGEQVFTDVYWDAPGCGLIEKDWWLRSRAGCWELKASGTRKFRFWFREEALVGWVRYVAA